MVENRPGAVQTLAVNDVLKQSPDGHSVLVMSVPLMAAPALLPNLGFQLQTDVAPVIKVSVSYNVLVVNPSLPAKSVSELVALLKEQPDKFTFSSGGFGTPAHLIGEMFKLQTGVPRYARAISAIPTGHWRSPQWHEPLYVHYDAACARFDQFRQVARPRGDGAEAGASTQRRADNR